MKHITFNRILIAIVLVYFPIATLGSTGSFWSGVQAFGLLLSVIWLGFTEGQRRSIKGAGDI